MIGPIEIDCNGDFSYLPFEQARKIDLEGIIAKRMDSKYYPEKRSADWLKIKNINVDDLRLSDG